jgi:hypothetical protein
MNMFIKCAGWFGSRLLPVFHHGRPEEVAPDSVELPAAMVSSFPRVLRNEGHLRNGPFRDRSLKQA